MTETNHARSRRASVLGLVLQILAVVLVFILAQAARSTALTEFAFFLVGGVPIWFVALLVFRQHELAALEALDLELLRREKQASGGGEALFAGEGGGGLGFLVAQQRLEWMQRWLVPFFGLVIAAYLAICGGWLLVTLRAFLAASASQLPAIEHLELSLVLLVVLTLLLFLYSRYASGMGRQPEWQLLRACGSYMLASTLVGAALVVCYGASLYSGGRAVAWELVVAWAIPLLMILLGAEALLNFVFDIYRPRAPGAVPRACFDSRLLGLISEPGGIAHSLAEAINYQFGFQVSQTWFYQLLVRVAVPLVWVAAVATWLLTSIFVVEPYERAIVERFGRQVDPERPLGPGAYLKWPWPIDVAYKYNVDQLHQFAVGYQVGDTPLVDEKQLEKLRSQGKVPIELWTDEKHSGRDHFNFIVASPGAAPRAAPAPGDAGSARLPINLARMELFIQYRIRAERLGDYTQRARLEHGRPQAENHPDRLIRSIAWSEVCKLCSSLTIDELMDPSQRRVGELLRERIGRRVDELRLGLEVVYCGLTNVHPEKTVAEAFRRVVAAQQEKIAEIRKARVEENKTLAEVAGDKRRAVRLARAIDAMQQHEAVLSVAERSMRDVADRIPASVYDRLRDLTDRFEARFRAELNAAEAREERDRVRDEFDLGMGRSVREVERATAAAQAAESAAAQSAAELREELAPLRETVAAALGLTLADLFVERATAAAALEFWSANLNQNLGGLEGAAAVTLEQAKARRWEREMRAAGELALVVNERDAYSASPQVYKARRYLDVITHGIRDARKYFLAFRPQGRKVHVRLETEDVARPDLGNLSVKEENP